MGRKNRQDYQLDGFSQEISQAVQQLGDLRELDLENYISKLIKRSDSKKIACEIIRCLEMMNDQGMKTTEKDKKRNATKIDELRESLQKKSLTPMEKRFIYEEIADLIREMESIRRYWLQKSLTSFKYVGAVGAVLGAALLFRKRK